MPSASVCDFLYGSGSQYESVLTSASVCAMQLVSVMLCGSH